MASSFRTKIRIAASVVFASGFFDAVLGRFLFEPRAPKRQSECVGLIPPNGTEPDGWQDLAGAVHVHSTYSDGAGDVPTVMDAARRAGVDWLLLSDHNTQRPLRDGWQERYTGENGGPLLLIGTEVTVRGGAFLLALDMPREWEPVRDQDPQSVINAIRGGGGLPLISLPFDVKHPWREWDVTDCAGMEVINLSTVARRHINLLSLAWLAPVYWLCGARAALRSLIARPDDALARWDQATRGGRPFVGLASLDAHALMKIGRRKYPLPSYEDSFRAVTTHVLVPESLNDAGADPSARGANRRAAILDALRNGRCYLAFPCLGDPSGFRFLVRNCAAGVTANMGERLRIVPAAKTDAACQDELCFAVRAPNSVTHGHRSPRVLWRLLRDGRIVAAGTGSRFSGSLSLRGAASAVYRVEGFRYAWRIGPFFAGARPWLFSNPIYVESVAAPAAVKSGKDSEVNTQDRNCSAAASVYEPVAKAAARNHDSAAPTVSAADAAFRRR